jgi:hypothetical protein
LPHSCEESGSNMWAVRFDVAEETVSNLWAIPGSRDCWPRRCPRIEPLLGFDRADRPTATHSFETVSARQAYLKALAIAERLAQAKLERADYQRDLIMSYVKISELNRATRGSI